MAERLLIFKCLLISPSDVSEERNSLLSTVNYWNAHNGKAMGVRVELVRWETHSTPEIGDEPQAILNKQLCINCDFGIAIFWSRLGTATSEHPSGSIEEIENLLKRNKKVSIYFKTSDIPQKQLDDNQFEKLKAVKEKYSKKGLISEFDTIEKLQSDFSYHLTSIVDELLEKNKTSEKKEEILTAPKPDVRVVVSSRVLIGGKGYSGETRFLTVNIQNYSPAVVIISSIMIEQKNGGAIIPTRDGIDGKYNPMKIKLVSGDDFTFNIPPGVFDKTINPKVNTEDLTRIVVSDAIGRRYYSSEEDFTKELKRFLEED
jgi:hypothetical protein